MKSFMIQFTVIVSESVWVEVCFYSWTIQERYKCAIIMLDIQEKTLTTFFLEDLLSEKNDFKAEI